MAILAVFHNSADWPGHALLVQPSKMGGTESWYFPVYCLFCLNFFFQITESWLKPVCFESTTMAIFGPVCPFLSIHLGKFINFLFLIFIFSFSLQLTSRSFILPTLRLEYLKRFWNDMVIVLVCIIFLWLNCLSQLSQ